jgi:hypothetical protein
MSLKNPDAIPKIPKTRKKTTESLKNATPTEKKGSVEYLCKAFFSFDKILKKQTCNISIETIKEFTVLNYTISTDVKKTKNVIDISVLGLNTLQTYYTVVQPARTELFFEELFGRHTVNIIKQDGSINSAIFDFNIYKKEIILVEEFLPNKKNNKKFCGFEVAAENFSFSE